MAGAPETPVTPPFHNLGTAPIVYFDLAPTYGVMNGVIQVELAGRTLSPGPGDATIIDFITTGRLRCSPAAAASLRDAIDKALEMLQQPQNPTGTGPSTLN